MKRHIIGAVAAVSLAFLGHASGQTRTYPDGTIRFVVPSTAGGANDVLVRMIVDQLQKNEGWKAFVENRAGASNIIGTANVAQSPADGLTVGVTAAPFVVNPTLQPKLPYDTLRDFIPLTVLVRSPLVLLSATDKPWTDLSSYLRSAKASPDASAVGVGGVGTLPDIGVALLRQQTSVDLRSVPYKGGGSVIGDGIGGQLPSLFMSVGDVMPHIASGKLRPLAVATKTRIPELPNAPTFLEQGVPMEMSTWYGLILKSGTPPEVVSKLHAAIARVMDNPAMKEWATRAGFSVVMSSPEEARKLVESDIDRLGKIIRANNIKAE